LARFPAADSGALKVPRHEEQETCIGTARYSELIYNRFQNRELAPRG
jgi:hypothetical protein